MYSTLLGILKQRKEFVMIRKAIKYNGNKEFVKQIVKTLPREAPDRVVTFSKGEMKIIGDDIGELAARDLIKYYPNIYRETEVEVDDLTFAEETLKIIKEDLMENAGLSEEDVTNVIKRIIKPDVQEVVPTKVEVQVLHPLVGDWMHIIDGVIVNRQKNQFKEITVWNIFDMTFDSVEQKRKPKAKKIPKKKG